MHTLFSNCRVSLDNWQTALRKQYAKRDPQANPLGPEPNIYALSSQDADIQPVDGEAAIQAADTLALNQCSPPHAGYSDDHKTSGGNHSDMDEKDISINWLQLPMLSKLESMHTLIEWQFQHPMKLRNIMKSDDELALWVRYFSVFLSTLTYVHPWNSA